MISRITLVYKMPSPSSAKIENVFKFFRFLRILFVLVGLPSFRSYVSHRWNKSFVFIWECYAAFGDVVLYFAAFRFFGKFLESGKQSETVETFVACGYVAQLLTRMALLKIKRKSIDSYFAEIDDIEFIASFDGSDANFVDSFKAKYKTGRKVVTGLLGFQVVGCLVTFLVAPILFPMEKDVMPASYPFKNNHHLIKNMYQAHDLVISLLFMTRTVAIDFFCITLISFHAFQQECLKNQMKFLMERTENQNDEKERVKEWLRYHQQSLRNIDRLKGFLQPLLLVTYVYSLVNVVSILLFILVEGELGMNQKVLGSSSIFACFAFLGWFCVAIDELKEELEDLPLIFDLGQVIYNRAGLKSVFLIFCPRSYRNLKISAMGIFTLSSSGFAEVISYSFSALATFWQLRGRVLR